MGLAIIGGMSKQPSHDHPRAPLRAILIGFALVVLLVHLSSVALMLRHDHMGSGHLPRTALFPVIFLAMGNALWKRLKGRALLKSSELVIIYAILVVMSSIPGQQFSDYVYFGATGPIYYATPSNGYESLFFDHIKSHYFASHATINPTGIIPAGPLIDWWEPHGRQRLGA